MPDIEELMAAIAAKQAYRERCALRAFLLERRCSGLRDDNPWDWRLRDLSIQIDALDELHDRLSDEIGRLNNELREIEAQHARRCVSRCLNPSEY
jgi:hypothetical protein